MKKFPVTSKNSNEYLAVAEYTELLFSEEALVVKLYKKVSYKFLWKNKTKLTKVYFLYFEENESRYHDVVKAIEFAVTSYETKMQKELEQEIYQENLLERSKKELEEWDGVCK